MNSKSYHTEQSLKELIKPGWTLFLDRDGVINRRLPDEYVKNWDEFEFLPGVTGAIKRLGSVFERIFIVTNQQGVAKGLMTMADIQVIHAEMLKSITKSGGRVDQIYVAPQKKEENHIMRKPNVGMALRARKDFPGTNFRQALMVGDSISDMEFGKKLGMITVFIGNELPAEGIQAGLVDYIFKNLEEFAKVF